MDNEIFIESLHVKDIGFFKNLDIKFNKKFNYIIGPNGSGKTSILKCIALTFAPSTNSTYFRYGEDPELWIDLFFNDQKIRTGFTTVQVSDRDKYRKARLSHLSTPPRNGFKSLNIRDMAKYDFWPLFIGSYRRFSYAELTGMSKKVDITKSRENYRREGIRFLEGETVFMPSVKQWLINKYFKFEKAWARIDSINWDWFIKNIKYIGPTDLELEFIEIRDDLEPFFSINGVKCYLEELSAGFQAVLSLIFKIFNWIESINEGKASIVENAIGTVLIDELDIHLHPEWQFTIRETLDKLFPNLQFIITTHSPHLITTAKENELIILPSFSRDIKVEPSAKIYAGWTTDRILEDLMGVKSLNNTIYQKLFREAQESINNNDIENLKRIISEFREIAHPSDTIVEKLKIQLASMVLEEE